MINDLLVVVLVAQALTAAVPIILAGLGELAAQRSGILNIGLEGIMLSGCCAAFVATAVSGHGSVGIISALLVAAILALIFALSTIYLRVDQIIAGMAINFIAVGGSGVAWAMTQQAGLAYLPDNAGFSRGIIPGISAETQRWLADIPLLGPWFFDQYGMLLVALLLSALLWWINAKTRVGIALSALGDEPDACAKMGIAVRRWRLITVLTAGMLAGLAGAYLSIMRVHGFAPLMTGGIGFVILALVIFARWRVLLFVVISCTFGLVDAVQHILQASNTAISHHIFKALPFIVALFALMWFKRGSMGPKTLGQSWPRE
jgi:general nucleoside transport system permease protein